MDLKKWTPVVSIASVIIFFIWGWLEGSFKHSWLIFIVAGLVMVIMRAMDKKDNNKDNTQ